MASPWIDVSVTLRTGMVTSPGDPPARISHALDMERGDPCTKVGTLRERTSVENGP
jgi:kynurenine formamidase